MKCSYCGSDMDCPDVMVKADKHTCSFCTDFLANGTPEGEVKEKSLKERELSSHYPRVEALAQFIFDAHFEGAKLTKQRLRELGKRAIAEEMYFQGIASALDFLLHVRGPQILEGVDVISCPENKTELFESVIEKHRLDMDPKQLEEKLAAMDPAEYPLTAEGIARFSNDLLFDGDWKKHLEWTETHGSDEQKREDIPLMKELMEKGEDGGAKKPDC